MTADEQFAWTTKEAQEEVRRFLPALSAMGISLEDLVSSTPRSWKEREKAKSLALEVANNPELASNLRESPNSIPWDKLHELKLDPGFFQKYSTYINAVIVIMSDPYPVLGSMVRPWVGGDF